MNIYHFLSGILLAVVLSFSSCKHFIEVEAPKNSMTPAIVFQNNDLATSAVLGLYEQMALNGYASGGPRSLSVALGLSADEFIGYGTENVQISQNELLTDNFFVLNVWSSIYARIYNANAILEGLDYSDGVTPAVKKQLKGEVLFNRAFNYFYLVNLFGEVPLHLSTDYQANAKASKSMVKEVYDQVINDLKAAELLLEDNYITIERVRPNKAAVQALLARTFLYRQDWPNAEKYANLIIEKSNTYKLISLDQIFLSNSLETIWQLVPTAGGNTPAGNLLILTTTPSGNQVTLKPDFVASGFETGDQRKIAWIRNVTSGGITYYYPFKYKVRSSNIVTEYHTVFRLAEQFLIRAEARAQQENLSAAIDDLDAIRRRAGLLLIKDISPTITKEELLNAIQKERSVELFSEWGHRWFDLKRTNRSTEVLAPIKPKWKAEYVLFPIPKAETDKNTNIKQNQGY